MRVSDIQQGPPSERPHIESLIDKGIQSIQDGWREYDYDILNDRDEFAREVTRYVFFKLKMEKSDD